MNRPPGAGFLRQQRQPVSHGRAANPGGASGWRVIRSGERAHSPGGAGRPARKPAASRLKQARWGCLEGRARRSLGNPPARPTARLFPNLPSPHCRRDAIGSPTHIEACVAGERPQARACRQHWQSRRRGWPDPTAESARCGAQSRFCHPGLRPGPLRPGARPDPA